MRRAVNLIGGVLLSSLLLAAALPPAGFGFLGWICLVPLLVSVRGTRFFVGFVSGLLTLTVTCLIIQSGLLYTARSSQGDSAWIVTGCTFFGFAISVTTAVWAEDKSHPKPLWWYAGLAVLCEACLLLQLPAHLALTLYQSPFVLVAAVGGIWLLSFAVWMANLWLAQVDYRRGYLPATVCGALMAISAAGWRSGSSAGTMTVGILQSQSPNERTLVGLHKLASKNGAQAVVWPEYGGASLTPLGSTSILKKISAEEGSAALITSFPDDQRPLPRNTAVLFAAGTESQPYAKQMLFGAENASHVPGNKAVAVTNGNKTVGLNICFDSCYPWIMRDTARLPGVQYVALPTLDPSSPHHFISAVHAAFTTIRAAELGMPIVRAEARSYSQIVNSWGQTIVKLAPGEGVAVGKIDQPHNTPARMLGDWFLYICGVVVVGWPIVRSQAKRRGNLSTGTAD